MRASQQSWSKHNAGRTPILLMLLVFIAYFLLALVGFSSPLIVGDEIFSVQEASRLRLNPQGMVYHLFLSLWMQISADPIWLRIPGIILGALSIPVVWLWLNSLRGKHVATLSAALLICAPVFMSLVVFLRLYSFFIFSSALLFAVYTSLARLERRLRPSEIALLLICGLLVLSAHLFGAVVVGLIVVHWVVVYPRRAPRWVRLGLILAGLVVVGLLVTLAVSPRTVAQLYQLIDSMIFSNILERGGAVEGPKGLSLVILAKPPLLFFEFIFGEQVYPLDLPAVIPGVTAAVLLLLLGIWRLFRTGDRFAAAFPIIIALGSLFLTTVVFDPLVPPSFMASIDNRHIAFILPVFFWVIAEGVIALKPRIWGIMLGGVFIVSQLFGLWSLHRPAYNFTDYDPLMRQIAALEEGENGVVLLAEGRTAQFLRQNYRGALPVHNMWDYPLETNGPADLIAPYRQILFTSLDFKDSNRCVLNQYLIGAERWRGEFTHVSYPLIAYLFDRTMPSDEAQTLLPPTFFHMRFQDLALPQQLQWGGRSFDIISPFTLPTCRSERAYTVSAQGRENGNRLLLLSNVVGRRTVPEGTRVGTVTALDREGNIQRFEMRVGSETAAWDEGTCAEPCFSALSWQKRVHFLGFSAYPRANDQFTAHIWGAELALDGQMDIESITLEVEPDFDAEWNIWGLYLLGD